MRIVIQRVTQASVTIDGQLHSTIGPGLMVLVGVREGDTADDMRWLAQKTVNLRIFDDEQGVMNRNIIDAGGEVLAVSQFTLNASTKKGVFGAEMQVALVNDGPVTIIIDSRLKE